MNDATALDDATLAQWRAEEAPKASPFIDPYRFRQAREIMHLAYADWLTRVVGRPVTSWRQLDNAELAVAVKAVQADMVHLEAVYAEKQAGWLRGMREAEAKIAAARQAASDQWQALASRLPVPVTVCHNWTARHLEGYEQGGNHIVVLEDLHADRLHRKAQQTLCETPSRARELRHVSSNVGDEKRIPNCKACLRHAERLAA